MYKQILAQFPGFYEAEYGDAYVKMRVNMEDDEIFFEYVIKSIDMCFLVKEQTKNQEIVDNFIFRVLSDAIQILELKFDKYNNTPDNIVAESDEGREKIKVFDATLAAFISIQDNLGYTNRIKNTVVEDILAQILKLSSWKRDIKLKIDRIESLSPKISNTSYMEDMTAMLLGRKEQPVKKLSVAEKGSSLIEAYAIIVLLFLFIYVVSVVINVLGLTFFPKFW